MMCWTRFRMWASLLTPVPNPTFSDDLKKKKSPSEMTENT